MTKRIFPMKRDNHLKPLLARFSLLAAVAVAACHHTTDAAADAGDTDTGSDTGVDTDTDTGSDSDTDTESPFPSDCSVVEVNGLEIEWCVVPGGVFRMGCDGDDEENSKVCQDFEQPVHEVEISGFEMMATEVTVAMFRACIESGPCDDPVYYLPHDPETAPYYQDNCNFDRPATYENQGGYEQNPINCVSWHGLRAFCQWIGGDLPTEAQWERAARGEHDGLAGEHWFSPWKPGPAYSQDDAECTHANYEAFSGLPCNEKDTTEVGELPHTSYGLHDMAGNVAEWTLDWFAEDTYTTPAEADPTGPETGDYRVVRGGAWDAWGGDSSLIGRGLNSHERDRLPPTLEGLDPMPDELLSWYGLWAQHHVGGRCVRPAQ